MLFVFRTPHGPVCPMLSLDSLTKVIPGCRAVFGRKMPCEEQTEGLWW